MIRILACICLLPHLCFAFYSLEDMSLEEKVGQLLVVHFNGKTANEEAKILIQKVQVGGMIYYTWANGLYSPSHVLKLSSDLQKLTEGKIPLFIAIDQEGGLVTRLSQGFTVFPGNKALGMTNDPMLAEESAFIMGQEMRAVGINMNLAPVADINSNPLNPVIGIRSFGDHASTVTLFAKNALHGYHKAGLITSLKHFPGHGDVTIDSHKELPIIKKSRQELEQMELLPFKTLAKETDTIMTAHLMVPSIDPTYCATLSKEMLDILRKDFNFDGVIISDSLMMQGLLKNCSSIEDGVIKAFNAGCDLLLLGGKQLIKKQLVSELSIDDIQRIHASLLDALKRGLISEERLNASVQRILNLKNKYALLPSTAPTHSINNSQHQALAKKIASLGLRVTNNKSLPIGSLHQYDLAIFAPKIIQEHLARTSLLTMGKKTYPIFFNSLQFTDNSIQEYSSAADKSDVIIFCSYNAWTSINQATLIRALLQKGKPMILITLRDSLDASLFPEAHLIISTSSPTTPSIQAACDLLDEPSLEDS